MSKYRIVKKTDGLGEVWWEVQKKEGFIGPFWRTVQNAAGEESARRVLRKLVAMENITEEVVHKE